MKIINISTQISYRELLYHLTQNLNTMFHEQRGIDINFKIESAGNAVEITEPINYEGVLFKIEIHENELWITRSEHYTDDVNSLTVESILNSLFEDIAGEKGIKIVQEG